MKGVFRYLNNAVNADDYDAKIAHDDLPKNKRVNFIRCITLLYLTNLGSDKNVSQYKTDV